MKRYAMFFILPLLLMLAGPANAHMEEEPMFQDGAVYRFLSSDTGMTLSASNYGISANASTAQTESWDRELNQAWRLHLQADGTWKLECLTSGRYLAVYRNSKKEGAVIALAAESDSASQCWRFEGTMEKMRIVSVSSGLCLQFQDGVRVLDAKIVQAAENDGVRNQFWRAFQVDDGTTVFPRMLMLQDPSIHAGCPEILKEGDTYYLLAWDNTKSCSIRSSKNLTDWSAPTQVYSYANGLPEPWMEEDIPGGAIWCPGIYKIGNTYYVYYAISSLYSQRSTIGCYANTTLDVTDPAYAWEDRGPVIRSYVGDSYNCIDPCVVIDEAGLPWLVFGSAWTGIKITRLNPETGLLLHPEGPELLSLASRVKGDRAIEAGYVIRHEDKWYLFAAVDIMVEGKYHNGCGRADALTGPYYARDGVAMLDGGVKGGATAVTEAKENVIMPGHASIFQDDNGQDYLVTEYWEKGGALKLCISTIVWDAEGWPWTVLSPSPLTLANGEI